MKKTMVVILSRTPRFNSFLLLQNINEHLVVSQIKDVYLTSLCQTVMGICHRL